MSDPNTAPRYYYVYNGGGDVVALVDAQGTVVASYSYDAFGQLTSFSENFGGSTTWTNPYRYDGRDGVRYDGETGLYWLSVRAYDPSLGRFLSRDPLNRIPLFFSDQPYVYAGNNPLVNVDPSGQKLDCTVGCGTAVGNPPPPPPDCHTTHTCSSTGHGGGTGSGGSGSGSSGKPSGGGSNGSGGSGSGKPCPGNCSPSPTNPSPTNPPVFVCDNVCQAAELASEAGFWFGAVGIVLGAIGAGVAVFGAAAGPWGAFLLGMLGGALVSVGTAAALGGLAFAQFDKGRDIYEAQFADYAGRVRGAIGFVAAGVAFAVSILGRLPKILDIFNQVLEKGMSALVTSTAALTALGFTAGIFVGGFFSATVVEGIANRILNEQLRLLFGS